MEKHTLEVLISYDQIIERVKLLAETITKDFEGEELLVVGVLKGLGYLWLIWLNT